MNMKFEAQDKNLKDLIRYKKINPQNGIIGIIV